MVISTMRTAGPTTGPALTLFELEQPHSMRRVLVSAFLADSIQQIHSLRASGVMSSHVSNALASKIRAFFRSAGRSWTTPPEISFLLRALLIDVSLEYEMAGRGIRTSECSRAQQFSRCETAPYQPLSSTTSPGLPG